MGRAFEKGRVTIKEVARAANVTPQTVSRAFRNAKDISEFTRKRILEIAEQMNYIQNSAAIALRRGSMKLVAVVYDNLLNPYFTIMTDFIQLILGEMGYSMLIISERHKTLNKDAYMLAISKNVDGIITFIEPENEIHELMQTYSVPVLLFGRKTDVEGISCVYNDDSKGAEIAANRLIACDCKNLGIITEPLEISCAYDRYQSFMSAVQNAGWPDPVVVVKNETGLEKQLVSLHREGRFPDGIFCFNDMLAFETIYLMQKNEIPPVKIIGFDDIQSEIHFAQRLETIGTDKKKMAGRAIELLIKQIENPENEVVHEKSDCFLVCPD